jgi:hypothetical protein
VQCASHALDFRAARRRRKRVPGYVLADVSEELRFLIREPRDCATRVAQGLSSNCAARGVRRRDQSGASGTTRSVCLS